MRIRNLCSKINKKYAGIAALAVCLLLSALLIGVTIARYRTQLKSESSVRAKEFYFTSDFLDGETHVLAPDSETVSFTLGNHADELRWSEVEIAYMVAVTDADGNAASVTVTEATGTLPQNTKSDATVKIEGLESGKTYIVTATGAGGYEKTLTATIQVLSSEAQLYQHQEKSAEYLLLTVWNEGDTEGNVTIAYTGIPDNTNPNMTDWTAVGSANVPIPAHGSKVFRFFGSGATVTVTDAKSSGVENKIPG